LRAATANSLSDRIEYDPSREQRGRDRKADALHVPGLHVKYFWNSPDDAGDQHREQ
jgi:hypothetical protein